MIDLIQKKKGQEDFKRVNKLRRVNYVIIEISMR